MTNAAIQALQEAGAVLVPFDSSVFTSETNVAYDGTPESLAYEEPDAHARHPFSAQHCVQKFAKSSLLTHTASTRELREPCKTPVVFSCALCRYLWSHIDDYAISLPEMYLRINRPDLRARNLGWLTTPFGAFPFWLPECVIRPKKTPAPLIP